MSEISAQTLLPGQMRESETGWAKTLPGFDSQVAEELLLDCLTTRLEGLHSSISARTGCKSSVAEITGKSNVRTQIKSREELRQL